jgi:hypothetical protein
MIQSINTVDDVKAFFNNLFEESLNFHPDEDFANYINGETKAATYTAAEADLRNDLMDRAFEVCDSAGVSIYDLAQELSLKYTGLDKFFKSN